MTTIGPAGSPVDDNETDLHEAATTGTTKDLSTGDARLDDPAGGANWGADRQICAAFLIELLTGTRSLDGNSPRSVKLRGARITGSLNLEGATLTCPLELENCHIGDGWVILVQASAPRISMSGCYLATLDARQLQTEGDLELNEKFTATAGVYLHGAHIRGQLDLTRATLVNAYGAALGGDGLTIEQDMLCRDAFTATGEVRLPGAHIGGQLDFTGATLTAAASRSDPEGTRALAADGLIVDHDMHCGFTATGEVRLLGARIDGDLSFAGAIVTNPGKAALTADSITVKHNLFCGVTATGEVSLLDAHIGGRLAFTGAVLANPCGTALKLEGASATALLLLPKQRPDGAVDLTNAKVGTFSDDRESWPEVLYLRGFAYDSFANDKVGVRDRLRWLTLHPGRFAPQLYNQLAAVYRRAGEEQTARKIAVTKERRRRRPYNPLSWLWYATVGYGYRTWLAGAWLVVLVALGTWVFSRAYPAHMIAFRSKPPAFHAVAYTLDLILPVISLGQKSAWQPEGSALLYWSWALTVAGWVLTTAVVAALAGILKRD